MKTILERVVRFLLLLLALVAFCGAVLYTALQTKACRPIALNIVNSFSAGQLIAAEAGSVAADTEVAPTMSSDASHESETNAKSDPGPVSNRATEGGVSSFVSSVATIDLVRAETSTISRTFTGVLTPAQTSELGFKRVDRIVQLPVDQGDTVNEGDTLAVLDIRSLLADKDVLLAELRATKARLAELEAGPRQQTIDAARAKLQELQSLVELAKITSDRQGRLIAERASSQKLFDNARLQKAAAESRYQSQLQVVRELEAGTRKEQIEAQKAAIQKLEAGVASLAIKIDESTLKAPYDAIVSKRLADVGMIVAPGSTVLRIVQQDQPEAWIGLPTNVAGQLSPGDKFLITLGDKTVDAKLRSILPELDAVTRTQTAVFVIDAEDVPASFGQVVRLDWSQEKKMSGFWLPTTALTRSVRGLWSVFVVERDESEGAGTESETYLLRHRDVEVLRIETDRVLLRGTLKPGDRVVAAGVQKLVAGQIVKAISHEAVNQ